MATLNLSKKRIVLICVFLAIFTLGTIFIFITPLSVKITYGLSTETSDGAVISFNVFEPVSGGLNKPAIIIGHGSMVNKEMLKGYALELAAAGFVAVPFDFRGHGQSTMVEPDNKTKDIAEKLSKVSLSQLKDVKAKHDLEFISILEVLVPELSTNPYLTFEIKNTELYLSKKKITFSYPKDLMKGGRRILSTKRKRFIPILRDDLEKKEEK